MMKQNQQLQKIQTDVLDAFMAVDCESQQACKKAASIRHLQMRRAIEAHFEKKELRHHLKQYDFD
jgi:restriction endonuclease